MDAIWTLWWVWAAAALVLAVTELLLPGFVLLGFAIGAAAVSVLLLIGLAPGLTALLVIFAVLSLLAWIGLRRAFRLPNGQVRFIREDINK
ncbi:hypothetical protein O4H61_02195 [Roseovarius aestuarii]|nr:hypothetical protein [Roseovarius aestuarii]